MPGGSVRCLACCTVCIIVVLQIGPHHNSTCTYVAGSGNTRKSNKLRTTVKKLPTPGNGNSEVTELGGEYV